MNSAHPYRLVATILVNDSNVAFDIIPIRTVQTKRTLVKNNVHGFFKRDVSQNFLNDDYLGNC